MSKQPMSKQMDTSVGGAVGGARAGGARIGGARIDHLGIAVESIAAARGLYEALGLRVTHEETVEHEGVRVAMIPLGESRVELLEPLGPETTVGRFLSKRGPGLHHVALHVDNIEAAWAELQACEVTIVSPAIQTGAGGHLYFFVHPKSTGGVLLEICQDPICQDLISQDPA